jgi:hypothetical protein
LRITKTLFLLTLTLLATTALADKPQKTLVCHVGNETGPGGETYLDDPSCTPGEDNAYFCPDAGKIDLIVIAKAHKHLENPAHEFDGISDYEPAEISASGSGTEDSDGNGIDDGCEPPAEACPCWSEHELQSVTAENKSGTSCSGQSSYPYIAMIVTDTETAGFIAAHFPDYSTVVCGSITGETEEFIDPITPDEADACIAQIAARCRDIGDPIDEP